MAWANAHHYTAEAQRRRLDARAEERRAMEQRLAERGARDPCARCCVRPERHDEFGCGRYVEGRLRT